MDYEGENDGIRVRQESGKQVQIGLDGFLNWLPSHTWCYLKTKCKITALEGVRLDVEVWNEDGRKSEARANEIRARMQSYSEKDNFTGNPQT